MASTGIIFMPNFIIMSPILNLKYEVVSIISGTGAVTCTAVVVA
jgi:hypothetical protein